MEKLQVFDPLKVGPNYNREIYNPARFDQGRTDLCIMGLPVSDEKSAEQSTEKEDQKR